MQPLQRAAATTGVSVCPCPRAVRQVYRSSRGQQFAVGARVVGRYIVASPQKLVCPQVCSAQQ